MEPPAKRDRDLSSLRMAQPTTEIDPVCGMKVDPKSAAATSEFEGKTYYFCCQGCKVKFDATPLRYLEGDAQPEPMHGEKVEVVMTEGLRANEALAAGKGASTFRDEARRSRTLSRLKRRS